MLNILAFSDWRTQKISDIFSVLENMNERIDYILYAGDDVGRFFDEGINYFTEISEYTIQNQVLAVVGNDDTSAIKHVLKSKNVHDLHDNPFLYDKYAFIGLEGATSSPAILLHSEEYVEKYLKDQMKKGKNREIIILSHAPPHGILDLGIRFAPLDQGTHHIGSTSLRKFIEENVVRLVICGHCHSQGGREAIFNGTKIVNVSSHDQIGSKGNFAFISINTLDINVKWLDTHEIINKNSLLRINGIGFIREKNLFSLGISTIDELAKIDVTSVAKESSFSEYFLKKLNLKAKSIVENNIYQIAPFNLSCKDKIFLDIETDISCKKIWLIGLMRNNDFQQFYAEDWTQEKMILIKFLSYIIKHPNSILVSYSCTNFDKYVLLNAFRRHNLNYQVFLSLPHYDLCQILRRCFIFPNQDFSLKQMGAYLKYQFKNTDIDGLFVALEYHRHIEDNVPLDSLIFGYNEDDVKVIPHIINYINNNKNDYVKYFTDYENFLDVAYIDMEKKEEKLLNEIKKYYEEFGSLIIRQDKRYNGYNTEIRFYAKDINELKSIRSYMLQLGFSEGSPYIYKKKKRCYIPYYGKEQVIQFINLIQPERKNDIRLIT